MKINTKDMVCVGLLTGFALIGLWLNMDHNLGSARRMGPGYMPMLTFYLLLILTAGVFFQALTNGPDPLTPWSPAEIAVVVAGAAAVFVVYYAASHAGGWLGASWNPLGLALFVGCLVPSILKSWRPLFLVSASFALFGIILEPLGLMVAIVATVVVSALADETQKPLGVAGCAAFLCALCWVVFIWYLDIRVPVWPQLS
ncbi:tripartite tricarboxylate transporter TctB family protein [Roseomonas rosulenta]|uniref:tripartite tricarboxylate transporter TctB family protein n=1 Tax=Roseomonas rosulenta TaxID=2748667 RepID=UPI0018E04423|nr:tripartite tricarboxylate transporter TctB family protein [Roseomonas rosulenta]